MAFGMITIVGTPFLLHRGPSTTTDTQTDPGLGTPDTPRTLTCTRGSLSLPS